MKRFIVALILISWLTSVLCGCYNTERHARRLQESFVNICLDGPGIN